MRIAIVGGTGLVGGHLVQHLQDAGHEPVVIARSAGVDALTGDGLDKALAGVRSVVDVSNSTSMDVDELSNFFTTITTNLLRAERDAGVAHHVVLSIVGIDRVQHNPHFTAKLRQEHAAQAADLPVSILRATQFFEFAEQIVSWTRDGDTAVVPPLLIQPAAARDVAGVLADIATGPPQRGTSEVAGPRREDLVDLTRRILAARGQDLTLQPAWGFGPFHTDMAGDVLLPGPDARTTPTDLAAWLAGTSPTT
jgi:uncharacterized protein YbjT (DUF2867 family)